MLGWCIYIWPQNRVDDLKELRWGAGEGVTYCKTSSHSQHGHSGQCCFKAFSKAESFLVQPLKMKICWSTSSSFPSTTWYIYIYIYLPIYFLKALYNKGRKRKGGSRREEQLLNGSICPSAGISYPVMATAITATCSGQGTSLKIIDDHRPPSLSALKLSVVTKGEKNFKK